MLGLVVIDFHLHNVDIWAPVFQLLHRLAGLGWGVGEGGLWAEREGPGGFG